MSHCLSWKSLQADWWMVACHIVQFVQCAIVLLVLVHILQVAQISQVTLLPCELPWFSSYRRTRQLCNTVYWKLTLIQTIENIPLTSLVDIRILLKERASKETDFSPAIPCYHTRFQRAQHLNVSWPATIKRHPERPREISTRRSRDAQVHKTHSQMLGKFEYTLPAKFWRLVGCTEMLSW